jgi:RimJ/RimL family protein N-acetyltransferase
VRVVLSEDFGAYDDAVADFLSRDAVGNTVALTVLDQLRVGGGFGDEAPWFGWALDDGGGVVGAIFRTPPYFVGLPVMSVTAAEALGAACADRDLPGAIGRIELVRAFANGAGRLADVHMTELQYVLHDLVPPRAVPGEARAYTSDDGELYREWMAGFFAETGLLVQADPIRSLEQRLAAGGTASIWWADGEPVALASRTPVLHGVPRIGPVWTQPAHRGRGYGAAVTAAVCADAFAAGADACTLYTDADNPTSNGVYARLGFQLVGSIVEAVLRG